MKKSIIDVNGSKYLHIESNGRHFYCIQSTNTIDESTTLEQPKVRKVYQVGDINPTGEMKMPDGSWVYVGKQGKNHPKVKHLFNG